MGEQLMSFTVTGTNHEIVVGNIGTVYSGPFHEKAEKAFNEYKSQSVSLVGRAGGESVTWFKNNFIHKEFVPEHAADVTFNVIIKIKHVEGDRVMHNAPTTLRIALNRLLQAAVAKSDLSLDDHILELQPVELVNASFVLENS